SGVGTSDAHAGAASRRRADGEDLHLEAASGRLVDDLLAGGVAEEGLPERGAWRDDVVAAALLLDGADEVGRRLVVAPIITSTTVPATTVSVAADSTTTAV